MPITSKDKKKLDRVLGVVLDDEELVITEVSWKGDHYELLTAGREPIKDNKLVDHGRIGDQTGIILKFRQLMDKTGSDSILASINIPPMLMTIKNLESEKELLETFPNWFKWEAEKHSISSTMDYKISWSPLRITTSEGEDLYLLCSAPNSIITERINLLKALDLSPLYVEPDPIIIYNAFIKTYPEPEIGNFLFIDVALPSLTLFATFSGRFVYGGTRLVQADYSELTKGTAPDTLFESLAKEIKDFSQELFSAYGDFPQNAAGIVVAGFYALSGKLKATLQNLFLPPVFGTLPHDDKKIKIKLGKGFSQNWASYLKSTGLAIRALNAEE